MFPDKARFPRSRGSREISKQRKTAAAVALFLHSDPWGGCSHSVCGGEQGQGERGCGHGQRGSHRCRIHAARVRNRRSDLPRRASPNGPRQHGKMESGAESAHSEESAVRACCCVEFWKQGRSRQQRGGCSLVSSGGHSLARGHQGIRGLLPGGNDEHQSGRGLHRLPRAVAFGRVFRADHLAPGCGAQAPCHRLRGLVGAIRCRRSVRTVRHGSAIREYLGRRPRAHQRRGRQPSPIPRRTKPTRVREIRRNRCAKSSTRKCSSVNRIFPPSSSTRNRATTFRRSCAVCSTSTPPPSFVTACLPSSPRSSRRAPWMAKTVRRTRARVAPAWSNGRSWCSVPCAWV